VDDIAASQLIRDFYRQLQDPQASRAVALQRAQRAMLSTPLPYFLSSAMASSNAARTTAANNLAERFPWSLTKAELSIVSNIIDLIFSFFLSSGQYGYFAMIRYC